MKPILVGLQNPYSADPLDALVPYPERSAGHRLWKMLSDVPTSALQASSSSASAHRSYYKDAFERHNICLHHMVGVATMKNRAGYLSMTFKAGSTVFLLGANVRVAFTTENRPLRPILIHPQVYDGITWRCIPHPSGRTTQYNDPVFRMLVGLALADVLHHSRGD